MNSDVEARVIGSVLIKPEVFEDCGLRPGDFQVQLFRQVWQTIGSMIRKGEKVDPMTVAAYGYNLADLGELAHESFAPSNAPEYAKLMRQDASRRQGDAILRDAVGRLGEPGSDVNAIIADTQMSLERIAVPERLITTGDAIQALRDYVTESRELQQRFGIAGIPTGHMALRHSIGGWRKKSFYVLAARPGEGKSSAALHSAITAAEAGVGVGYITLEMTSDELLARHLSARGQIPLTDVLRGRLNNDALAAVEAFSDLPISLDETSTKLSATLSRMAAMRREGCEVIFVDHFGLLSSDDDEDNRTRELGQISWSLRHAAKSLDVAVVGLYQLNRGSVMGNEKPALHNLRGSGEIEENATHAILLHNATQASEGGYLPPTRKMEWIIAKNRNGPRGTMDITSDFDPRFQTWT